jgi:two-component system, OmpR family, alkaline phosphatase synthesis response regulator PhoP
MSRTVLVVEDEANIVDSLSFLMKQAGFEVLIARDGDTAIRMMQSRPADLILLDIMLPRRDGYEVCREIRSNPNWDSVRIVMLTARGHDFDRRKGMRLGADAYITKPFSTRDIVSRVQELLGPEPG